MFCWSFVDLIVIELSIGLQFLFAQINRRIEESYMKVIYPFLLPISISPASWWYLIPGDARIILGRNATAIFVCVDSPATS